MESMPLSFGTEKEIYLKNYIVFKKVAKKYCIKIICLI